MGCCAAAEWDEFKTLDYSKIYSTMIKPAFIFDGECSWTWAGVVARCSRQRCCSHARVCCRCICRPQHPGPCSPAGTRLHRVRAGQTSGGLPEARAVLSSVICSSPGDHAECETFPCVCATPVLCIISLVCGRVLLSLSGLGYVWDKVCCCCWEGVRSRPCWLCAPLKLSLSHCGRRRRLAARASAGCLAGCCCWLLAVVVEGSHNTHYPQGKQPRQLLDQWV